MGPGLGQFIYRSLDNGGSCPSPPSTPAHLNSRCAKLFCFDFHLPPFHLPAPSPCRVQPSSADPHLHPHPHPRLTHRPDARTGAKAGRRTTPTHTLLSVCPTPTYVSEDESRRSLIGYYAPRPPESLASRFRSMQMLVILYVALSVFSFLIEEENRQKHMPSHPILEGLISHPEYEFHQIISLSVHR